jgi:hypothetical protein
VGFPRSGTTLLQSLLAAHPGVLSLPETFFFESFSVGRVDRLIGRAGPRAPVRLAELPGLGIPLVGEDRLRWLPIGSARRLAKRFVASLDAAATAHGARLWLEKTPLQLHLRRVREIERYVDGAIIVHMVRAGLPAIASLVAVTRQYPDGWGGARSVEQCVNRWRGDAHVSIACADRPNHIFVSYERLIGDTPGTLGRLCERLGLGRDQAVLEAMLTGYGERSSRLVRDEPWKAGVATTIRDRNAERADLFSEAEREHLRAAIADEESRLRALPLV